MVCNYVTKLNAGSPMWSSMVQQHDLCYRCDRGKHLAVKWHHCHLFRDGMLDYFQTLMEKMSFQFGATGHYHRSFPPPSNTSAKTTASNCWRYYCLFALVYTTTCPQIRCAHTRRHHLACLVPGALVATSYSPALIGIGDRTYFAHPFICRGFKTTLSSL